MDNIIRLDGTELKNDLKELVRGTFEGLLPNFINRIGRFWRTRALAADADSIYDGMTGRVTETPSIPLFSPDGKEEKAVHRGAIEYVSRRTFPFVRISTRIASNA